MKIIEFTDKLDSEKCFKFGFECNGGMSILPYHAGGMIWGWRDLFCSVDKDGQQVGHLSDEAFLYHLTPVIAVELKMDTWQKAYEVCRFGRTPGYDYFFLIFRQNGKVENFLCLRVSNIGSYIDVNRWLLENGGCEIKIEWAPKTDDRRLERHRMFGEFTRRFGELISFCAEDIREV